MSDNTQLVIKRIGTYDLSGSRLGKGNFATVELAVNRVTNSKVAIKIIDTRKIKDDYVKRNILREALILKKIHHPNVVKLYETLKQRGIYCLVTEYVAGGELLSFIRCQHESKLSEAQARPIVRQIASALHHLHGKGIVHRDLKMENILLDENKKNIKLVDFGLSNIIADGQLLKTQCGSPEYAAPELFKKDCSYGPEVDLWSLGVVAFGMLNGKLPFRTFHSGIRGRNDLVDQMSSGLNVTHSKSMNTLSPECRDLLRKLLEPNPFIRLPLKEVMIHPWITKTGEWPLQPYTSAKIDHEIIDKILNRVASLIKMPRSKLEVHISRNRYDTISGIYHLTLDEYLGRDHENIKPITKEWKDRHLVGKQVEEDSTTVNTSKTTQKDVIKVSIKKRPPKQDISNIQNKEKDNKEHKCAETELEASNKTTNSLNEQGLQIRGMRLYAPKTRDTRTCRPYTTESKREYRHVHSRARPRSMYANNNTHQVTVPLSDKTANNQSKDDITPSTDEQHEKPTHTTEHTDAATQNQRPKHHHQQKRVYSGMTPVTIKTSELVQRRPLKSPRHIRQGVHRKPTLSNNGQVLSSPGHPVTQKGATAKTNKITNQTERKLLTQSAQDKTERVLCNAVKKMELSEKDLVLSENSKSKISESMFNIYQRYLANCKPHHKRLSIMQAHDIIQREPAFQAKYGKKINTEKNDVTEGPNAQVTTGENSSCRSAQKAPQYCIKNFPFPVKSSQYDKKDLLQHSARCTWFKDDVLASGVLNNKNVKDINSNDKPPDELPPEKNQQVDERQRRVDQEINLRRQKQKELFEEVEREHSRIERELQDTERVKLIEQYLDDVYSRYNPTITTVQLESTARLSSGNKTTPRRKGNIYSWLPDKHQHGKFGPATVNMPASILHQCQDSKAQNGSAVGGSDKKIEFKEKSVTAQSTKNETTAKFRFFNEWSKTSFNNYVNSDGEFLAHKADQDFSNQFSDPSYWLKTQINSAGHY